MDSQIKFCLLRGKVALLRWHRQAVSASAFFRASTSQAAPCPCPAECTDACCRGISHEPAVEIVGTASLSAGISLAPQIGKHDPPAPPPPPHRSRGYPTTDGCISVSLQKQVNLTTPLTRRFGRTLQAILVLWSPTCAVSVMRGRSAEEMFDGAMAPAVGAIPEELPAIVTITLAIGLHRMALSRAIIRKQPAVEALGSTMVICSDRTGAIPQNRMTVQHRYGGGALVAIEEPLPASAGHHRHESLELYPRRDVVPSLRTSSSWPLSMAASGSCLRVRWRRPCVKRSAPYSGCT